MSESRERTDKDVRLAPVSPDLDAVRKNIGEFADRAAPPGFARPTVDEELPTFKLFVRVVALLGGIVSGIASIVSFYFYNSQPALWLGISAAVLVTVLGVLFFVEWLRYLFRLRASLERMTGVMSPLKKRLTTAAFRRALQANADELVLEGFVYAGIQDTLDYLGTVMEFLTNRNVVAVLRIVEMDPKGDAVAPFLKSVYAHNVPLDRAGSEPQVLPIRGTLAGHVLENGESLICGSLNDRRITGKFLADTWPERGRNFQSAVLVPVVVDGKTVGVVGVDSRARNAFRPEAVKIVQCAADAISILLQLANFLKDITLSNIEVVEPMRPTEQRARRAGTS